MTTATKNETKVTKAQQTRIKKFFTTIQTPKGFERKEEIYPSWNRWQDSGPAELEFSNKSVRVIFRITIYENKMEVMGETLFRHDRKWFTFDRRGIDNSFYMYQKPDKWHSPEQDMKTKGNVMLEKQILRAWEKIEYMASTIVVPNLGYHVTKERKAEITTSLKAGKCQSLYPGGMGTGHDLSTRKPNQWAKMASKELKKFFEVKTLWISTFDHD